MRVFDEKQTREEYWETQIQHSRKKFAFCKVSVACVQLWKKVITRCEKGTSIKGPILCLATRNGREIDLFRNVFFGSPLRVAVMALLEQRKNAFSSRLRMIETAGESRIDHIDRGSVVGVEINPDGKRQDVLTASFDDLPKEWEGKFQVVYSNSLDHAQDPYRTAKEWFRVLSPGGYLILGSPGEKIAPSKVDVVGNIGLKDIVDLFPGELIYYNKFGNAFQDTIVRKKS
jgi:SAM-dependent methyltransferase